MYRKRNRDNSDNLPGAAVLSLPPGMDCPCQASHPRPSGSGPSPRFSNPLSLEIWASTIRRNATWLITPLLPSDILFRAAASGGAAALLHIFIITQSVADCFPFSRKAGCSSGGPEDFLDTFRRMCYHTYRTKFFPAAAYAPAGLSGGQHGNSWNYDSWLSDRTRFSCPAQRKKRTAAADLHPSLNFLPWGSAWEDGTAFSQSCWTWGLKALSFFLIPTLLSIAVVYPLTTRFNDRIRSRGSGTRSSRRAALPPREAIPWYFWPLGSLLLGIAAGAFPSAADFLQPLVAHSDWLLYLLMFSRGNQRGAAPGTGIETPQKSCGRP